MFRFSVPCLMGVEGLVADELRFKGFRDVSAENGRVLFSGDEAECARANIRLRCGERVLMRLADFEARSFDELFEHVKAIPWEEYIGSGDAFPVKGHSLRSQLHSVPDCQRIIKGSGGAPEVRLSHRLAERGRRKTPDTVQPA